MGNNRVVADLDGNVVQITDYYPFGMTLNSIGESIQPYKYGGKEYDKMLGLDQYDFHARQYDPATIRFTSVDPLAEKYYSISPYVYCLNNPIGYIDPDGRDVWTTSDPDVIERFLWSFTSRQGIASFTSFKYSGWTHYTDKEIVNDDGTLRNKVLSYSDKNKTFTIQSPVLNADSEGSGGGFYRCQVNFCTSDILDTR